ncbi:hypothetical protein VE23_20730 [Paenibacillus sp. D9]|uniref:HAD family hydrolase n=1 Tax=Paenibacillus sp. D9 TaxID=665792 RepID=UPI00061F5DD3|nr:HAD family hydrolase [Paenibacillus sp. D9]KKC48952.1 hypothetical protein VE23_20730 [Paenibacillus sp. D9]
MTKTIKLVLFDFDGTLADTLPLSFSAFKAVFKQFGDQDLTNEDIVAMFGPTEDDIIRRNIPAGHSAEEAIRRYYAVYENGHRDGTMTGDSDVAALLDILRGKGIAMGVITGKSRRAYDISVEALNIADCFAISVTGDDVDKPKPDPEGILLGLGKLGASPAETVFIGDSNADILAGKAAGVRTFGVRWLSTFQSAQYDAEPDGLFSSTAEFLQLLNAEAAGGSGA